MKELKLGQYRIAFRKVKDLDKDFLERIEQVHYEHQSCRVCKKCYVSLIDNTLWCTLHNHMTYPFTGCSDFDPHTRPFRAHGYPTQEMIDDDLTGDLYNE